jgi:hypothetical protein
MVSTFESGQFGKGMGFTTDQHEKGLNCTESAIRVNGTAVKNPLIKSPFWFFSEYKIVVGKEATGHSIIWPCSLKIVSSILNMVPPGWLATIVAIIESERMFIKEEV